MKPAEINQIVKGLTAKKNGRPSSYTKELSDEICMRIACGESLMAITQDKHIPDYRSVMRWRIKSPKFRQKYIEARQFQAETFAESLVYVAYTEVDVHRARLITDNMKWTAVKLLPKVYGERVEHDQNITVNFNNAVPRPNVIESDATYSVPKQIAPGTDPS